MSGSRAKKMRRVAYADFANPSYRLRDYVRGVIQKGRLLKVRPDQEKWAPCFNQGSRRFYQQLKRLWTTDKVAFRDFMEKHILRIAQQHAEEGKFAH